MVSNITGQSLRCSIVYGDASVEPDTWPRLGWVCTDERGHIELVRTLDLDQNTLSEWLPRQTHLFAAETFCFLAAELDGPEFFASHHLVWFADNEASVSTIRGACAPDDINDLAEAIMAMMGLLLCRLWVGSSNPADGLSRQGLTDPLFGTVTSVASCPKWQSPGDFSLRCLAVPSGRFPCWSLLTIVHVGLLVSVCESCQLTADNFVCQRA